MSSQAKTKGKGVQEFRALHDKAFIVPQKINAAIVALGAEGWEYEMAFMKSAGLSVTDLANFREPFEGFIVTVSGKNPKRVWCGSKALATKFRAMA